MPAQKPIKGPLPPYVRPIDWLPAVNDDDEDCPPFAIVMVNGVDAFGLTHFERWDGNYAATLLVNGPVVIPAASSFTGQSSAGGQVHRTYPATVAYLGGSDVPTEGETWGPVSGSWFLQRDLPGFTVLGGGGGGYVNVVPQEMFTVLARITAYTATGSGYYSAEQVVRSVSSGTVSYATVVNGIEWDSTNPLRELNNASGISVGSVVVAFRGYSGMTGAQEWLFSSGGSAGGTVNPTLLTCASLNTDWSYDGVADSEVNVTINSTTWTEITSGGNTTWPDGLTVTKASDVLILAYWSWETTSGVAGDKYEFKITMDDQDSTHMSSIMYPRVVLSGATDGGTVAGFFVFNSLLVTPGTHQVKMYAKQVSAGASSISVNSWRTTWTALPYPELSVTAQTYSLAGSTVGSPVCVDSPDDCCPASGSGTGSGSGSGSGSGTTDYWWCIDNADCFFGTEAEAMGQGNITGGPYASQLACLADCGSGAGIYHTELGEINGSGTSLTLSSVTVPADDLLVVKVWTVKGASGHTVTGVTYDGDAMTQAVAKAVTVGGNDYRAEIWYLPVTANTTGDIVASFSASVNCRIAAERVTNLVNRALQHSANASGTSSQATVTLNAPDDSFNAVACNGVNDLTSITYGGGVALDTQYNSLSDAFGILTSAATINPAVTVPATYVDWAMVGAAFN